MKKCLRSVGGLLFLFFSIVNYAQSNALVNEYKEIFDNYIGVYNKDLNRGPGYYKKFATVNGTHVFFKKETAFNGFIEYDNQTYQTELKYDIVNDLVVVKYVDKENPFSISLVSESVKRFEFDNYKFVRLENTAILNSFYKNGFFEFAFSGKKFNFYIKHTKIGVKKTNYHTLHYLFKEKDIYILDYNEKYYRIKTKKDLINALPQYKEDIKSYFKHNKFDTRSLLTLFLQLDKK